MAASAIHKLMGRIVLLCLSQAMRALALVVFLLMSSPVVAADLTVSVRNSAGKPVSDAVVTVYPASGVPAGAIHFDWPQVMAQQNLQFDPFVLIVPAGGVVAFPNRDQVRHHVYSFSPAHPFQLKLFGKDETRTVRFDKVGVIALGCNIHDQMVAFIKVVDTPYAAKTGANGEVTLHGLPAGQVSIHVWHPYLKGAQDDVVRPAALRPGGGREGVAVDLRTAPERRSGGY
jgi:plastocyanin